MKLNKALVFSADTGALAGLCSAANVLAQSAVAVVLGEKSKAEGLLPMAEQVVWLGEKAADTIVENYTGAIESVIKSQQPELVLVSGSTRDRCIAAKLAVRLDAGVITDAAGIAITDDGKVQVRRNVYGGTAEATVIGEKAITIVIAPAGLFDETKAAQPGTLTEQPASADDTGISLVSVAAKQEETVNIVAAKRVVGVGRGLGSQDNLAAVEALAAKLGAEVGCTRPIAEEEHWMARSRYIGVSGVSIRPSLYLAMGVSGQVQHMVGASDAKLIVAVNKDAKAPIFQNCDIGLVADMNKVVQQLTELF
jgi:electron transfer flavoprotein alpha subunit